MIEITRSAQDYFGKLIEQQDQDDLGLRIQVLQPGTPRADCDLQFCPDAQSAEDDRTVQFDDFKLYVAANSESWLDNAVIDFDEADTGGQLSIKAPNIKGNEPDEGSSLEQRIAWVLEAEINPRLASHGGMVALDRVTEDKQVLLRFGGGCHGCGMVDVTLKEGIEKTLQGHFPEITGISDATDHSTGENPYYDATG